jgi:hypothetical protein
VADADVIEVCWVGIANRLSWMGVVPSLQVRGTDDGVGPWMVVDGVAGFDYRKGAWRVTTASLPEVLGWVLRGQITFRMVVTITFTVLDTGRTRQGGLDDVDSHN